MIKYLKPWRELPQDELTIRVVEEVRREFGAFVDPMAMNAAVPPILAAAWCSLRESMLAGRVQRRLKEAMAAVISQSNRCPFCLDAHTIMLHASGSAGLALALRRGKKDPFKEPQMRALAEWAAATGTAGHSALRHPPFDDQQAPEIIGTVFCMQFINRVAHALLSDTPVPPSAWPLKRLILWLSGYYFASAVQTRRRRGESLGLLPPDLPPAPGLEWARPVPAIHTAFSALTAAIEDAARPYLEAESQQAILQAIQKWKGEAMPLGSQWIDQALEGLEEDSTTAARLALLAALASYRVDRAEIEAFRPRWPQDAALLAVLCWGSLQATLRLTSWVAGERSRDSGVGDQEEAEMGSRQIRADGVG